VAGIAPNLDVQASGGVRSLDDVAGLALQGVAGVILGRSLLQGEFTMAEALAAAATADASC
jgi:phosphoribosylformimino-5-aminoimidazole carboxamide ribotide isomerase